MNTLPIIARNVISGKQDLIEVPVGKSIYDILVDAGVPDFTGLHIFLEDRLLNPSEYKVVYPMEGQRIFVCIVPQGGDSGKNVMRTMAFMAVAVAAAWWMGPAGGAFMQIVGAPGMGWAVAMGTSMIGGLLINALIPPATPDEPPGPLSPADPVYGITGSQNRFMPFECVPKTLGLDRVYPPLGAKPWTETKSNKQFVHMLLCLGRGKVEWSNPKIGDTDADLEYTEIHHGTGADPPKYFNQTTVFPDPSGQILLDSDTNHSARIGRLFTQKTTHEKAISIGFEFYSPSLTYLTNNGVFQHVEVGIEVFYKKTDEDDTMWRKPNINGVLDPDIQKEHNYDENTLSRGNMLYLKGYPQTTSRWGASFIPVEQKLPSVEDDGVKRGYEYDVKFRRTYMTINGVVIAEQILDKTNLIPSYQSLLHPTLDSNEEEEEIYWNWANTNVITLYGYASINNVTADTDKRRAILRISNDFKEETEYELRVIVSTSSIIDPYNVGPTSKVGLIIWDEVTENWICPIFDLDDGTVDIPTGAAWLGYEAYIRDISSEIGQDPGWYECIVRRTIPAYAGDGNPLTQFGFVFYNEYDAEEYLIRPGAAQLHVKLVHIMESASLSWPPEKLYTESSDRDYLNRITEYRRYVIDGPKDTSFKFNNLRDEIYLSAFKTISWEPLNIPDDMEVLSVTLEGSEAYGGNPDTFNVLVQGWHPIYDSDYVGNYDFDQSQEGFTVINKAITTLFPRWINIRNDIEDYVKGSEGIPNIGSDGFFIQQADTDTSYALRKSGLKFNGADYPYISIRYRQFGYHSPIELRFAWRTADHDYDPTNSSWSSPFSDRTADWQTINIALGTSNWMNEEITGIEIYFPPTNAGESFDFDYIRIQSDAVTGTPEWVVGPTSNPAWVYTEVSTGAANHKAADRSKMNTNDLINWALECDRNNYQYNSTVSNRTVNEMKRVVCAVGRAAAHVDSEGKYTVILDREKDQIYQVYSPRNSWGFSGSKVFMEHPHALRVPFRNAENNYVQDEYIVYNDHPDSTPSVPLQYDETTAEMYETTEYDGVMYSNHIHKLGRMDFASAVLRPEASSINVDPEYLSAPRGSRVQVAHFELLVAQMSCRIVHFKSTGFDVEVTVDEQLIYEEGVVYGVTIRTDDGENPLNVGVTNIGPGSFNRFHMQLAGASQTRIHDDLLVIFGEAGKTVEDYIIKSIFPAADDCARLDLVHYAPEIVDEDTIFGDIPEFNPPISKYVDIKQIPPNQPLIDSIISDERALIRNGDMFETRMIINIKYEDDGNTVVAGTVESQYRITGSGEAWMPGPTISGLSYAIPISQVQEGVSYDVRIRAISPWGVATSWTQVNNHIVMGKQAPPPNINPESFKASTEGRKYRLVWEAVDIIDFREYEIRSSIGEIELYEFEKADFVTRCIGTTWTDLITWNEDIVFYIKAIDAGGNKSYNAATATLRINQIQCVNLQTNHINNVAILSWDYVVPETQPPVDYALIYRSEEGENSLEEYTDHRGKVKQIGEEKAGTYWYGVSAVDKAGNESDMVKFDPIDIDHPPGYESRQVVPLDFEGDGATNIYIDSDGIGYAPLLTGETWEEHFNDNNANNFQELDQDYDLYIQPVSALQNATYTEVVEVKPVEGLTVVRSAINVKNFQGGVSIRSYLSVGNSESANFDANEIQGNELTASDFSFVRVRYEISSDGVGFCQLRGHSVSTSSKPIYDTGQGIITEAQKEAGVEIPFNIPFTDVVEINATYRYDPDNTDSYILRGYTVVVEFNDIPNPMFFKAHIFSDATTKAAGQFYWRAKGF